MVGCLADVDKEDCMTSFQQLQQALQNAAAIYYSDNRLDHVSDDKIIHIAIFVVKSF